MMRSTPRRAWFLVRPMVAASAISQVTVTCPPGSASTLVTVPTAPSSPWAAWRSRSARVAGTVVVVVAAVAGGATAPGAAVVAAAVEGVGEQPDHQQRRGDDREHAERLPVPGPRRLRRLRRLVAPRQRLRR